jgi:hypothetical protein
MNPTRKIPVRRLIVSIAILLSSLTLSACRTSLPSQPHLAPGYPAAQRFADACGGRVTDPYGTHGGPYVVDCTRHVIAL